MKAIYLTLLLMALCACGNSPTTQPASEASETEESGVELKTPEEQSENITAPHTSADTTGLVVYVTHDGNKYHTADCRYAKSAEAIKLSQAKTEGKTACDLCKPNTKTGEKQIRCSAKTKDGTQCKRMTTDASGKCYQHKM